MEPVLWDDEVGNTSLPGSIPLLQNETRGQIEHLYALQGPGYSAEGRFVARANETGTSLGSAHEEDEDFKELEELPPLLLATFEPVPKDDDRGGGNDNEDDCAYSGRTVAVYVQVQPEALSSLRKAVRVVNFFVHPNP